MFEKYKEKFHIYLQHFKYQPKLTARLDALSDQVIDQGILNEIVLWKVNRYLEFDSEIFDAINAVENYKKGDHRQAKSLITNMLKFDGCDIAMASTILRFKNPNVFPIIDRRAYRAIYNKKLPTYFAMKEEIKTDIYLNYIDEIIVFCDKYHVEINDADRLLYQLDKEENGKLN